MEQLLKKKVSYIPALPGYNTIELVREDDDEGKTEYAPWLHPIIGWEIAEDRSAHLEEEHVVYVKPVTLEGVDEDNPIVYPDGKVELPFMYLYDSVSAWVEEELESRKKKRAENEGNSSSAPSAPSAPDSLG